MRVPYGSDMVSIRFVTVPIRSFLLFYKGFKFSLWFRYVVRYSFDTSSIWYRLDFVKISIRFGYGFDMVSARLRRDFGQVLARFRRGAGQISGRLRARPGKVSDPFRLGFG